MFLNTFVQLFLKNYGLLDKSCQNKKKIFYPIIGIGRIGGGEMFMLTF